MARKLFTICFAIRSNASKISTQSFMLRNSFFAIAKTSLQKTYQATNNAMIEAYWMIGKRIVDEEQNGNQRASYGKEILNSISAALGKRFSARNLRSFRQFYLTFRDEKIWRTLCAKLIGRI